MLTLMCLSCVCLDHISSENGQLMPKATKEMSSSRSKTELLYTWSYKSIRSYEPTFLAAVFCSNADNERPIPRRKQPQSFFLLEFYDME